MLQIDVSGLAGEGKTRIIRIIEAALAKEGLKTLTVSPDEMIQPRPTLVDAVITEKTLRKPIVGKGKFDFLIGRTEAEAYELIQDQEFIVRVVSRNGIPMVATRDFRNDRVNISVMHNVVVSWTVG